MPTPQSILRASRPLFTRTQPGLFTRTTLPTRFQQQSRRWQSGTAEGDAAQHSWFKRMWDSPVGFKTVHFWAPVMKVRFSIKVKMEEFTDAV